MDNCNCIPITSGYNIILLPVELSVSSRPLLPAVKLLGQHQCFVHYMPVVALHNNNVTIKSQVTDYYYIPDTGVIRASGSSASMTLCTMSCTPVCIGEFGVNDGVVAPS